MFSFLGERERGEVQRKPHWAVSWCLLLLPECTAGEKGPETNSVHLNQRSLHLALLALLNEYCGVEKKIQVLVFAFISKSDSCSLEFRERLGD